MVWSNKPLAVQIRSLNNQIKRLLERSAIEKNEANLTGVQYAILAFLHEQNGLRDVYQRDIEAQFNIRRSTASSMVKLLEEQGFVRRLSVPEDARLKKVVLTEKAISLHEIIHRNMVHLEEKLVRGIDDQEMDQFYSTLEKIRANAGE